VGIFFSVRPVQGNKLDSVHENETGFGDLLATAIPFAHHQTETGFCNCFAENNAE
jgi:hypothetical protein